MDTELISDINQSLEVNLPETISLQELRQNLELYINNLINHNFEKLVFYLYRIDVDENKIKQLLALKEGENAAGLIAELVIERQTEKIKSRRQFTQRDNNIDENEKW